MALRREVFESTGLFDEGHDCMVFKRVFEEAELRIVERAYAVGRVIYQFDNPFITTSRRHHVQMILHECIRNPANKDCKFAQELGILRF